MAQHAPVEQRKLLAIVVADIVGYSGLMARFEAETFHGVKELQANLIEPSVLRNHGNLVKYTGDGYIATFASALDAVRSCVEVQSGAKALAAAAPEDRRLKFRIGVNVGDVIVVPGDIYGDSVNVAARLQGLAQPGGIAVSRGVRDTVKGKFEIEFNDLGNIDVKNIPDPIGTYELKFQPVAWTAPRLEIARRPANRAPLLAGVAAAVLAAAGGVWALMPTPATPPATPVAARPPVPPPVIAAAPAPASAAAPSVRDRLEERIGRILPGLPPARAREFAEAYLKGETNRALAIAPTASATWRQVRYDSASYAEERALEGCQLAYGEPCIPVAVNDAFNPVEHPPWPLRDMPRVSYSGRFDTDRIPVLAGLRTRRDIADYTAETGPKAVAIHPNGILHVSGPAASQREAEERALAACNSDPGRISQHLPCLIYAIGDQVVLPQRLARPATPAPAATTAPAHPPSAVVAQAPAAPAPIAVPAPAAVAQPSFRDRLAARVVETSPRNLPHRAGEQVDIYMTERTNRAFAVPPGRQGVWRSAGHPTAAVAEERVLEGCMLYYNEACVLLATNDTLLPPSAPKPAARATYSGPYDPERIPANAQARGRADVQAYGRANGPKAMAIHPHSLLHIVTGAATQREAEERALRACTDDPAHRGRELPCLLYAIGNEVVLQRRLTAPAAR
jgi:class 3 adenylate cyclase